MESLPKKTETTRGIDLFLPHAKIGETSTQEAMELLPAEVLATVSHELRSPLTTIKGYTTTLLLHEDRITSEERREFLLTIKEACERLESIIARMLEMAQLETGEVVLQLSPVNLTHLIHETIVAVEQRPGQLQKEGKAAYGPERSVFTLRLEDTYGLPIQEEPVIQADRRLIEKMFFYLLENAVRHSPKDTHIEVVIRPVLGSGHIIQNNMLPNASDGLKEQRELGMRAVLAENQPMVEICIQDQGNGIAPEHLEHIFERFHRADMQLTREASGLGLGLAIGKYIVALHQGKIWAESEVGTGSSFHVQLPKDGPAQ